MFASPPKHIWHVMPFPLTHIVTLGLNETIHKIDSKLLLMISQKQHSLSQALILLDTKVEAHSFTTPAFLPSSLPPQ